MKPIRLLEISVRLMPAVALPLLVSACATTNPNIDANASAILRAACDKLAAAGNFTIEGSRRVSPALIEGTGLIGDADLSVHVVRPDKLKGVIRGRNDERHVYMTEQDSFIYDRDTKYYARFPGKPTINESLDAASENLGIQFPLQDLVSNSPYQDLTANALSGVNAGTETINGVPCDHLAFTQEGMNWDIWISRKDQLPRRLVIALRDGERAVESLRIDMSRWNLNAGLSTSDFRFSPPKGSREIDFIPEEYLE